MSIVMTGGGTGGHLAIVRAVKEAYRGLTSDDNAQALSSAGLTPSTLTSDDNAQALSSAGLTPSTTSEPLIYIGSTRGQDRRWFENDGDFAATYFLSSRGVVNQRAFGKVVSLWALGKAVMQARKLLKRHNARVVFSVGGYSAAPTAIAALTLGIPLIIHEQNAAMGTLNRYLRPYAKAFISSYDSQSPIQAYPVQSVFFDKARVRDRVKTMLFLGGSQGAKAINELALRLAPALKERGIRILHQAGERHKAAVKEAYEAQGIDAEVFGFTDRMPELMASADFAVARAGASTLWELAANALPALFVPYPYAAGDHQYHNARFLSEQKLAWVMRENELDEASILKIVSRDMQGISQALMRLSDRNGARAIAELLLAKTEISQ